jgi:hypothetical protein
LFMIDLPVGTGRRRTLHEKRRKTELPALALPRSGSRVCGF